MGEWDWDVSAHIYDFFVLQFWFFITSNMLLRGKIIIILSYSSEKSNVKGLTALGGAKCNSCDMQQCNNQKAIPNYVFKAFYSLLYLREYKCTDKGNGEQSVC